MEIENQRVNPTESPEIVLISVDSKYFRRHAIAWAWSVFINSMHGHIHIVNPSKKDLYNAYAIYKNTNHQVGFSSEASDKKEYKNAAFLASKRFFIAKNLMDSHEKILITDADSFLLKQFIFLETDVGIFLREPLPSESNWIREGTRVASGMISLSGKGGKLFIDRVVSNLRKESNVSGWKWFIDQVCIWRVYSELKESDKKVSFHAFTERELDWNFNEASVVWTGKGSRKDLSKAYVKKKQELELDYLNSAKVKPRSYRFLEFYDFLSRNLNYLKKTLGV